MITQDKASVGLASVAGDLAFRLRVPIPVTVLVLGEVNQITGKVSLDSLCPLKRVDLDLLSESDVHRLVLPLSSKAAINTVLGGQDIPDVYPNMMCTYIDHTKDLPGNLFLVLIKDQIAIDLMNMM